MELKHNHLDIGKFLSLGPLETESDWAGSSISEVLTVQGPEFAPQNLRPRPGKVACICAFSTRKAETSESLSKFQAMERPCLKKNKIK